MAPDSLSLIRDRARANPSAVALAYGGVDYSYADLVRLVDAAAAALRDRGLGPGSLLAVEASRSAEQAILPLAAMAAEAAFVHVDTRYPEARRALIVSDARPELHVTVPVNDAPPERRVTADRLRELVRGAVAGGHAEAHRPPGLAYVSYTSGSTGVPKGVMISRANLTAFATSWASYLRQWGVRRVTQFASCGFDQFISETIPTLSDGGTVVGLDRDPLDMGPDDLFEACVAAGSDFVMVPPSVLSAASTGTVVPRVVGVTGERCSAGLVRSWAERATLLNIYGPTETTAIATACHCADPVVPEPVPIGALLPHFGARVVRDGVDVGDGAVGELVLSGRSVALGYWERTDESAASFRDGAYWTGDLVSRTPQGFLFHGRVDDQVKIGGVKVEPAEIEQALARWEGAKHYLVAVDQGASGTSIEAFVQPSGAAPLSELRRHLAAHLPSAAMPTRITEVRAWPRDPHGKVDRAALRELSVDAAAPASAPQAPADELEAAIQAAWSDELGGNLAGDFMSAGGTSLLALRVAGAVYRRTGVRLSPRDVLFAEDVRALIARARELVMADG